MAERRLVIETPELAAFLQPDRERILQGEELHRALAQAWKGAHGIEATQPDPEELPWRIALMWRLCRASAILKQLSSEEDTLDQATEMEPSPWNTPYRPVGATITGGLIRLGAQGSWRRYHAAGDGLPLLPPAPDARDIEGTPSQTPLERWCSAAAVLCKELNVARTEEGRAAMKDLLDPERAPWSGVSAEQVMAFEELVVDQCRSVIFQAGDTAAVKHFRENLGLTRKEALALLQLTKARLTDEMGSSVDTDRAIAVQMLKELFAEAQESMDIEQQLRIAKLMFVIQGLTRVAPEDSAADFLAVVDRVSKIQDSRLGTIDVPAKLSEFEPRTAALLPETDDAADELQDLPIRDRKTGM